MVDWAREGMGAVSGQGSPLDGKNVLKFCDAHGHMYVSELRHLACKWMGSTACACGGQRCHTLVSTIGFLRRDLPLAPRAHRFYLGSPAGRRAPDSYLSLSSQHSGYRLVPPCPASYESWGPPGPHMCTSALSEPAPLLPSLVLI